MPPHPVRPHARSRILVPLVCCILLATACVRSSQKRPLKAGVALAVLLFMCAGCASCPTPAAANMPLLQATLQPLRLDDVEADVDAHVRGGDYRFITICEFACHEPGVQPADMDLPARYGRRWLDGTSDVIENAEYARLMDAARRYAIQYNMALRQRLH
jgi:hypothetical protein